MITRITRIVSFVLPLIFTTIALPAGASTLTLVLDSNAASGLQTPVLTLVFGNNTVGDTVFDASDFISRTWAGLDTIGYPASNLVGATPTITGTVNSSSPFVSGFVYQELNPSLGFVPIQMSYETGNTIRGQWLTSVTMGPNGFFWRLYAHSITYNANGTPADFETNVGAVPLPAALPLLASGLGALGFLGYRRGRRAEAAAGRSAAG